MGRDLIKIGGYNGEILGGEVMDDNNYWGMELVQVFKKNCYKKFNTNVQERYMDNVVKIASENNKTKEHTYRTILSLTSFSKHYSGFMPVMFKRPECFFTMLHKAYTPFIDDNFLEVIFSVDYKYLKNKSFYLKLINKFYLKYFKDIPVFHGANQSYYKYNRESKKILFYKKNEINLFKLFSKNELRNQDKDIRNEIKKFNSYMGCNVFRNYNRLLFSRIKNVNSWLDDNIG